MSPTRSVVADDEVGAGVAVREPHAGRRLQEEHVRRCIHVHIRHITLITCEIFLLLINIISDSNYM